MVFQTVAIVAALVAGPVIRNTSAAPGETPLVISAAATGTDAVAQTYIGMPRTIMISIAPIPPASTPPSSSVKNFGGTSAEINAATTSPISSARPMSRASTTNP